MTRRREPVAQHAHLPSPGPLRRIGVWVLAGLMAVVLAGGALAAVAYNDFRAALDGNSVKIGGTPPAPAALAPYPGAFNLLVTGTDECDASIKDFIGEDRCSGDEATQHLNDVNILVHVSAEPRRVTVLSFPRDLAVERPECTDENGNVTSGTAKINTAYTAGGLACVAATVSELTGMGVDFAAKVSFTDVIAITDAVGGVEVCVGGDGIVDSHTNLSLTPGPHTLQGKWALQFLRTRHGLEGGSDLARISNQQQYLSRLLQKLRSDEVLTNPLTVLNLATIASHNMQADTELADPLRLAQLAVTMKDVPLNDITFVSYPALDAADGSDNLWVDDATAQTLLAAIESGQPIDLSRTGVGVVPTDPTGVAPSEPSEVAPSGVAPSGVAPSGVAPSGTAPTLGWSASGQTADEATCSAGVHYFGD